MSWNIKTPGDYINGPLTVAGSATITGDLTVDTSTLKVDSTNDRVGIGTASPTAALHVNLAEVSAAAGTSAIITNTTGGGNRIAALRLNNLSNNWHIRAVGAVTDDLRIGAGVIGSEVDYLAIGNTGNVNVALGNVVMATSGKGIDFSATANSSGTMTSELLNDYEEGTWTPAYSPTTGSFTTLPTVGSGKYRKIGDTVFFFIDLRTAGTVVLGTASGNIQITGFPFACSAAGGNGIASIFQQFNLAVTSAHLGISMTASTSIATISKNLSNGAASYVQANELSTATGNFENLLGAFGMYNV